MKHVLTADQLTRHILDRMYALTNQIRKKRNTREGSVWLKSLFPHRRALLYFGQESTRTLESFLCATQNLGMDSIVIRDPSTSSEFKGETKLDSFRTHSSFVHLVVLRDKQAGLAESVANHLDDTPRPRPVINGGSGPDQHPTQALLDDYTLRRSLKDVGGIEGKTIALVGDLKRGRTVRSLAQLMRFYNGVRLLLVSPPQFGMKQDILEHLEKYNVQYEITEDFDGAVSCADAMYLTRVQDEHDEPETERTILTIDGKAYEVTLGEEHGGKRLALLSPIEIKKSYEKKNIPGFSFTPKHLSMMKPRGVVMHPGPRRDELDPACDKDPRVMFFRAMRNGMHVRTSLIYHVMKQQELEMKYGGLLPECLKEQCWLLDDNF